MDNKYKKSNSHLNTMRIGLVLKDAPFSQDDMARQLRNVQEILQNVCIHSIWQF